ncbi:hypothetical protein, partial [Vibrio alginolyticus]|uniref:hypothetical protein n=1 Tax=Vibrio alginolyticus TaxID=663 RepID=UPI001A8D1212
HGIITFILNRCRPQGKLKNSPAASNQRNGRIRGSIADAGYFRGLAGNMDFVTAMRFRRFVSEKPAAGF